MFIQIIEVVGNFVRYVHVSPISFIYTPNLLSHIYSDILILALRNGRFVCILLTFVRFIWLWNSFRIFRAFFVRLRFDFRIENCEKPIGKRANSCRNSQRTNIDSAHSRISN